MEPELEAMAGAWSPAKRLETARKLKRWARQLKVSAFILLADASPRPPRVATTLPLRKARLN